MNTPDLSKAPSTIGELRERLKTLGDPWTAAPHLNHDDPLPQPPRGGDLPRPDAQPTPGVRVISTAAEFEAIVHAEPPTNPNLLRRWVELGVLQAAHAGSPFTAPPEHAAQTDRSDP